MALIEKLTAIADALRQKLQVEDRFTLSQMPEKIDGVFAAGKQAHNQEFWDHVPMRAQKYMFAGPAWNVHTFFPKKSFNFSGVLTDQMFALHGTNADAYDLQQRLEDCGVTFDFSRVTMANDTFYNCNFSKLPYLDLAGCTKLTSTFHNSKNLHTIAGLKLGENTAFSNTFTGCDALANITVSGTIGKNGFDVSDCPLTRESLLSILHALKSGVSGLTVKLGASNLEKLSASEQAIATDKGWILQ